MSGTATFAPEIETQLDQLSIDKALISALAEGFLGLELAVSAKSSEYLGLSAPGGRVAAYVFPSHVDLDLDPEVLSRLVDWHGELRIVDGSTHSDKFLRVRTSDLDAPGVRPSVVEALAGAYQLSESRPPRAVATPPVKRTTAATRARISRAKPKTAAPATRESPKQAWEAVCPECFMTHRVGVDC